MYVRLTGVVESAGDKPWKTKDGSRSGTMSVAVIRLNDFITEEVVLADSIVGDVQGGEFADLIVEVTSQGGFTRARATGHWPREDYSHALKSA